MARTPSTMLELGTKAPEFSLVEPLTGRTVSKDDFAEQPILVAFICNHCPYVVHIREAFNAFVSDYQQQGIQCVAINSNDVENYPDDSPEKMIADAKQYEFPFVYLYDETQEVAKAYEAACTPDFFLFDSEHALYYRGQFDASRPRNDVAITGEDLRNAADRLLAGKAAPENQLASLGCNIKWQAGNEPDYF